jgi:hypothetical protein
MNSADQTAVRTEQIYLTRRSPHYWRVTFDIPPLNIFGPEGIPPLNEIISAVESDKYVRVVVFDSGIEGFFLTHYDFLAKAEGSTGVPPGPTAPALPDTPGLRHLTEGHPREDGPAGLLVGEGIPRNFASCGFQAMRRGGNNRSGSICCKAEATPIWCTVPGTNAPGLVRCALIGGCGTETAEGFGAAPVPASSKSRRGVHRTAARRFGAIGSSQSTQKP